MTCGILVLPYLQFSHGKEKKSAPKNIPVCNPQGRSYPKREKSLTGVSPRSASHGKRERVRGADQAKLPEKVLN